MKTALLVCETSLRQHVNCEDVIAWFATALDELNEKGILNSFFQGLAAKTTRQNTPSALTATGATNDTQGD